MMDSGINRISPFLLARFPDSFQKCSEASSRHKATELQGVPENSLVAAGHTGQTSQCSSQVSHPLESFPRWPIHMAKRQERAECLPSDFKESSNVHKLQTSLSPSARSNQHELGDSVGNHSLADQSRPVPDPSASDVGDQEKLTPQLGAMNNPWPAAYRMSESNTSRASHSCHVLQVSKAPSSYLIHRKWIARMFQAISHNY